MDVITPELVERCRRGDDLAWATLYSACIPLIRSRALRMGFSDAEAQDIMQETLVNLAKNIHTVDNPAAYVQSVCYRRCVDHFRRNKVRDAVPYAEVPVTAPNEDDSVAAKCLQHHVQTWMEQTKSEEIASARLEALTVLQSHLSKTGEPCKSLLRRRFFDDLPYKELSEKNNIPEAQVGVYLSRCLKRLKDGLQKEESVWTHLKNLWVAPR